MEKHDSRVLKDVSEDFLGDEQERNCGQKSSRWNKKKEEKEKSLTERARKSSRGGQQPDELKRRFYEHES